jgi:hypothetical protein
LVRERLIKKSVARKKDASGPRKIGTKPFNLRRHADAERLRHLNGQWHAGTVRPGFQLCREALHQQVTRLAEDKTQMRGVMKSVRTVVDDALERQLPINLIEGAGLQAKWFARFNVSHARPPYFRDQSQIYALPIV